MPHLEVQELSQQEVYKDIKRVNEAHRIDKQGRTIKEGQVCLVHANKRECYAVLRGYQSSSAPEIRMDDYTRKNRLNIDTKQTYEFEFEQVHLFGQLCWVWNATEIGYQVAARLGILGFVLGVAGLIISVASFVNWRSICFLFR